MTNCFAVATIVDNDAAPSLSINDLTVSEMDGSAEFTVSLSAASGKDVTVDYATAAGTATAGGVDFWDDSYNLTFYAGETTQSVWVSINDDSMNEYDETMFLDLSNPENATIADNQGQATITDDDAPPTISIDDQWNYEGETASFTVSLSEESGKVVSVEYGASSGSAQSGVDFIAGSGIITG